MVFDKVAFKNSNKKKSLGSLYEFLDIEIKDYTYKEILEFLHTSTIGDKKELMDHFIVKMSKNEFLVYNETTEQFVANPEVYRFKLRIEEFEDLIVATNSAGVDSLQLKK